jgi:hypothetical protein
MHRLQLPTVSAGTGGELVELLALGLARYAARRRLDQELVPPSVTREKICGIPPAALELPRHIALTVTPDGLQTESPNPRSTKWKRC